MKRKILLGIAMAAVFLALASTRVVCSSRDEFYAGERALQSLKVQTAIIHYRRSARWYAPGNPYVKRSMDRLWELGLQAEERGDKATALRCFRSIRGAILGARSFYTPHSERLGPVNRHIAALMGGIQADLELQRDQNKPSSSSDSAPKAGMEKPSISDGLPKRRTDLTRWHLAQLKRNTAPSVPFSLMAVLGFLLWVGSAFGFAFQAISEEDRLVARKAVIWGAGILSGLAAWMIGLALA